jgi:hypothetical protein
MKLYEFTVTDEHNLPKSQILEIAERSAAEEAEVREWGDFKVVDCQSPETLLTGEIRYSFEVEGEYADSASTNDSEKMPKTIRITPGAAAASEL